MTRLIDTSLWIDLTRTRSPRALKTFIAPYIDDAESCIAEPIAFELLRSATDAEARLLAEYFETLPLLPSPADLWGRGVELGRACRRIGHSAGSIDLLIAAIAIHHEVELVTFDTDFRAIARISALRVHLIAPPKR